MSADDMRGAAIGDNAEARNYEHHGPGSQFNIGRVRADRDAYIGSTVSGAGSSQASGMDASGGLFAPVYGRIEAEPEDPNVDRDELQAIVQRIERELARGKQARPDSIDRWLNDLARLAPNVFEVAVWVLSSPTGGIDNTIRRLAAKALARHTGSEA